MTNKIVSELYKMYGTDSGILFGIKERQIVTNIVNLTVRQCLNEVLVKLGEYEGNGIITDDIMELIENLKLE